MSALDTGNCWSLAACTIIAGNYLSHARILAHSFLQQHPSGRFYVLVVDSLPVAQGFADGITVVTPADLWIRHFEQMAFKYDTMELCTAVKPTLLRYLFEQCDERDVIYFDPDIMIYRPLDRVREALAQGPIVLTPHLSVPIPDDGHKPTEQDILFAGAYNLGFIALRRSAEVESLLEWWEQRLREKCVNDPPRGYFVDQRWVDLVPGLYPSTGILYDPSYNVAYWNLHSRSIDQAAGQYLVNGEPLTFFHFSGFDPGDPATLSRHQSRTKVTPGTPLARILQDYVRSHAAAGFFECRDWPYGYSTFANGMIIRKFVRRIYLDLDEQLRSTFGDPFRVGTRSFLAWIRRPHPDIGFLSPFLLALYRSRPDLMAAFPDLGGRDRAAFLSWAQTTGLKEESCDPELARLDEVMPSMVNRNGKAQGATDAAVAHRADRPGVGVNVLGYLRNEDGLGAVARGFVMALRSANVPVALKDLSDLSLQRSDDPTLASFDEVHPHYVNLICVNADQVFEIRSHVGEEFFAGRYNVGVWFWELPSFPVEWHERFSACNEVWAASRFIADALAPVSPIPVVRIPPVLTTKATGCREAGRRRIGAAPDEFVFLFIFDFLSFFERKNPLALIDAFKRAFAPDDPVRLVIKCVNQDRRPDAVAAMEQAAAGYPVSLLTGYWSLDDMRDLMAACDAYVSLHRSEGMGLTMADAMLSGKPVIATGWSGNMDFMTEANSYPVRYDLVEISQDVGPYRAGEIWANPSVDHAAELMRRVFENRAEADARGLLAKRDLETRFSDVAVGKLVRQRMEVIAAVQASHASSQNGSVARPEPPKEKPSQALHRSVWGTVPLAPPVLPKPDWTTSIYGWPGRLMKRVVSFLLGYHTYYQNRVNETFAGFMRRVAESHADLDGRLDVLGEQYESRLSRLEAVLDGERRSQRSHDHRLHQFEKVTEAANRRLLEIAGQLDSLQTQLGTLQTQSGHVVESVEERLARLSGMLREFGERHDQAGTRLQQLMSDVEPHLAEVDRTIAAHGQHLRDASEAIEAQRLRLDDTATLVEAQRLRLDDTATLVEAQHEQLQGVAADFARTGHRFAARPYMAHDVFGAQGDPDKAMGYALDAADLSARDSAAVAFADLFRGSDDFIAERQRVYLPFFRGMERVIDLGCGRGEFLRLLRDDGIAATGIELDLELAQRLAKQGFAVVAGDGISYLHELPDASLDGIFSAQVIEHLRPEQLTELLGLATSRLRPGGIFIAETVNPECYEALKTFYVDLSHRLPIFPQVLLHMCRVAGFRTARIFYPLGGGFTQRDYERVGEYAVVAVA